MSNANCEKHRLWVITKYYFPEVVTTGQSLSQTAEGLTDDFDVRVLTGQPNYFAPGSPVKRSEIWNEVEIVRVWTTRFKEHLMLNRVVNNLTLGISMFWASLHKFQKGDRILVETAPLILPFTAAVASLIMGCSYTLLVGEHCQGRPVGPRSRRHSSAADKTMHIANAWLFKHAARIIVGSREMLELISASTEGSGVPIKFIRNRPDGDEPLEKGCRSQNPAEAASRANIIVEQYRAALR